MQDQPSAIELVEAVTEFLRNHAMPQLQGHAAFHARVAANALDIVKRELEIGPDATARELARLKTLLSKDGTMEELNRELCTKIEKGELTLDTPGLKDHLWETTLTKLAIDQPKYSGYRRALEESGRDE
ncbi:DUF6285 domain-containing protein [Parvibaculum sp.]|jgi:hypothetical protein|uniref:DUF6285 domain-containing protein n=1 Tax=Parvibaculum sp. TaxID=2024848 RepID=UPI001B29408D|nr:DUF6285 domain-containing protein [Parvibaculum sp.]MBO6679122.1 hypothetical protein [Parvibaculum sp.]MBO6686598.1 hypothetical protein [Parvibaculum sp.]MBO6905937.1 hypothetical protein [Parvibaculum sp.]